MTDALDALVDLHAQITAVRNAARDVRGIVRSDTLRGRVVSANTTRGVYVIAAGDVLDRIGRHAPTPLTAVLGIPVYDALPSNARVIGSL